MVWVWAVSRECYSRLLPHGDRLETGKGSPVLSAWGPVWQGQGPKASQQLARQAGLLNVPDYPELWEPKPPAISTFRSEKQGNRDVVTGVRKRQR